ncbi:hypothetical protein NPIL_523051 [Nephila pilipes]|uniref:Uncharacterized protein n=1 Tax=Nephila pilipes TaxID=299642 RepID=A0A8X6MT37_NEPPI|nr:hypothetical protein NPIL_523051 [Nephila pilipes]
MTYSIQNKNGSAPRITPRCVLQAAPAWRLPRLCPRQRRCACGGAKVRCAMEAALPRGATKRAGKAANGVQAKAGKCASRLNAFCAVRPAKGKDLGEGKPVDLDNRNIS